VRIAPNWRGFVHPAQTEISRFGANSLELAAIRHAFCLCALPIELQGPFRRSLSLPWKIAFPDGGDLVEKDKLKSHDAEPVQNLLATLNDLMSDYQTLRRKISATAEQD
jgi:hypothetical protein